MDYSTYEDLIVLRENGICTITFNRAEQLNSMSGSLHNSLERIWTDLARDPEVNVVILTGAGRAFSAGGDIKGLQKRFGTPEGRQRTFDVPAEAIRLIEGIVTVPQPVIAAVNGDAMGLGATIALASDISVISETARFGDTHVRVGLVAGDGGAALWPLLIGPNRAKDFLLRGRVIDGRQAHAENLINYAVPAEQVLAEATRIAEEINRLPPRAVRWTKIVTNKIVRQQLNLVMDASIGYEMLSMHTEDHLEAVNAFIEKRKPVFSGK